MGMVDVDPAGRPEQAQRVTWIAGGALLLASVLSSGFLQAAWIPSLGALPMALFAVAAALFAIGVGRAGSITARKPLGTAALILCGVWPLIAWLLIDPLLLRWAPDGGWPLQATPVLGLMISIVAVAQIARAGVVPAPWHLAPAWALGTVALRYALMFAPLGGAFGNDQEALLAFIAALGMVDAVALCFLGVVAIVLGARSARPDAVPVFGSQPLS